MKALVISGGGSKGAFAGGVAEYLITEEKQVYDLFVGTSTGSLLIPHLASGNIEGIKQAYTTTTQKDVFNISPFKLTKKPDGSVKIAINHYNTLRMFLKGKKTFGETKNLRKLITRTLTKESFEKLKESNKKIIVTVANLSLHRIEYKYLKDNTYDDFCDWMWISCCFVPFMSLNVKNKYEYADGGFGNYIPIEAAIDAGATEIDVIVLQPKKRTHKPSRSRNAFDVLLGSMQFMLRQIAYDDILIGHLESIYNENVKARFFFTPRLLTEQSFYFDPEKMKSWWQEGYDFAKAKTNQ